MLCSIRTDKTPLEIPYTQVRDIRGHVVHSHPSGCVYVPSLGEVADRCIDAIGYVPDVIMCLHKVYIDAAPLPNPVNHFVDEMVAHGMSNAEAILWWEVMNVDVNRTRYRKRVDLTTPL